jgi:hypothetical protein
MTLMCWAPTTEGASHTREFSSGNVGLLRPYLHGGMFVEADFNITWRAVSAAQV